MARRPLARQLAPSMDTRTHWLWVSLSLLLVQGVTSYLTVTEDAMCDAGSHAPALLRLEASGSGSAALVEIRPRKQRLGCPLVVLAPAGRLLAVSLAPRPGAAAPSISRRHGDCSLQVVTSQSPRPVLDLDLCNQTSLEKVLLVGVHPYRHAALLTWGVSEDSADALQASGVLLTVVTRGPKACSKPGTVPCVNQGVHTLLCVASELSCDGQDNCPVGSFDEDAELCGQRQVAGREEDSPRQDEGAALPRDNVDTLAKALAHYGPWGYLMLGTLLCGALLMVCGLWECCCRRGKGSRPSPLPPAQPPTVYVISGGASEALTPEAATAPPGYEELDQPPDYKALFPADKDKVEPAKKTAGAAC